MSETFEEEVKRRRAEREEKPEYCNHCNFETTNLKNYSRDYGSYVGAHWLCPFCEVTMSASIKGAGGFPDQVTQDVAAMLHILLEQLATPNSRSTKDE